MQQQQQFEQYLIQEQQAAIQIGQKLQYLQLNDDLLYIENPEITKQLLSDPQQPMLCAFCNEKCFSETSFPLYSSTHQKYFFAHYQCFLYTNSQNNQGPSLISLSSISYILSQPESSFPNIEKIISLGLQTTEVLSFIWEIYHPISSFYYMRMEKVLPVIRTKDYNELSYWNMASMQQQPLYSANFIILPYLHFRNIITLFPSNSLEKPFQLEFLIDVSKKQKNETFELRVLGQYNMKLLVQLIDSSSQLLTDLNYISLHDFINKNSTFGRYTQKLLWLKAVVIELSNERYSPSLPQLTNEFVDGEEFENVVNLDNVEFENVKGKIEILAQRNQGSRLLQKLIAKISTSELELFISEIESKLADLMLDQYGNYMFQSLINVCTIEQRYQILSNIAPKMGQISKDKKGTHSLQTLVSLISFDQEITLIVDSIKPNVKELSFNQNGTHFIQKIILCFDEKYLNFVYQDVEINFVDYGNHSCGLCILKALMNKCKNSQLAWKNKFLNQLAQNCDVLIQNPFGNYAIQYAFEIYGYKVCNNILNKIFQKLIQFSSQKYSSNVIEKLVSQHSNKDFKQKFIKEIVANDTIREFMKNKYGTFILQKVCSIVDSHTFEILLQAIQRNLIHVHATNFKNKWESFVDNANDKINKSNLYGNQQQQQMQMMQQMPQQIQMFQQQNQMMSNMQNKFSNFSVNSQQFQ